MEKIIIIYGRGRSLELNAVTVLLRDILQMTTFPIFLHLSAKEHGQTVLAQ